MCTEWGLGTPSLHYRAMYIPWGRLIRGELSWQDSNLHVAD